MYKKLHNVFSIGIGLLLCFSLLSGCAKKTVSTADDSLKKITESGQFILGLDDSFPPLGFRNESNEIVGYDVDLAKEAARRMGVKLILQPIDWAAKEQELNTGKIDCIWNGFTITKEREQALSFTKPYLENAQVLVVRADSGIKTLGDMAGKKLGLQAGSSAADALNASADFKASLKEVVELKDNLTAFMDLDIKGVDAVLLDSVVANYNIKASGRNFVVLDQALAAEKYGIGFRKADLALRDQVQKILEEMAADGTASKISTEWFGSDISVIGK